MRFSAALAVLFAVWSSGVAAPDEPAAGNADFLPGTQRILFLGDSITYDGRYVAYFGRRELFTVDLYVADSRTGQVVKKLTSPNRNAHFDALSFIQSAGTWSPDGRKFAFVVFADGDNELSILDVDSGDTDKQVSVAGVGSLQNPAWSPDGSRIVFSGIKGGIRPSRSGSEVIAVCWRVLVLLETARGSWTR